MSSSPEVVFETLVGAPAEARFSQLVSPVISPMHMAVENDLWLVEEPGKKARVLRVLRGDMRADVVPEAMVEAARQAASLGVGPDILAAEGTAGALLMPQLGAPWRTGSLYDLKGAAVRRGVIAATRCLHAGPALSKVFDPFTRLTTLMGRARQIGVPLPADADWLLDAAAQVRDAVTTSPAQLVPCRNDGCASNIMIHEDGRVLLIDYDLAGMNDPAYDLGVLLAEATVFDDEAMAWVCDWQGSDDPTLLYRARMYGAVDDLAWAISAAINAKTSARITLEFRKYSEWRFMRSRTVLADRMFEMMVRRVAGNH